MSRSFRPSRYILDCCGIIRDHLQYLAALYRFHFLGGIKYRYRAIEPNAIKESIRFYLVVHCVLRGEGVEDTPYFNTGGILPFPKIILSHRYHNGYIIPYYNRILNGKND